MADQDRAAFSTPILDDVSEILDVPGDGQRAAAAPALKWLQHVPPLSQFPGERRDVPGCGRATVKRDDEVRPDSVLPNEEVGHAARTRPDGSARVMVAGMR